MVEYFMTGPVFGYAAGFALCLFSLYLLYRDKRIAAERGSMLEDSFSLQGHGLIFFNANERFCLANRQARIFDPFFTTKEQGKGTGLGLSMVYGLVKDIGGHIGVNSLPGQGTAMSIYLPVSRSQPQSAAQPAPEDITNGMSLKGFTALLVEDEPDILELVSDMLDRMGMNVIKAANGNQALLAQAKHAGSIDLLLTDIVMPEMNGVSLADMLCALRPDMKVIFISGYPAYGGQAKAELPEGAYFMAKPIQYEALAGLIHQRLSNLADKAGGPRWQSADAVRKKGEIRA